MQKVPFRQELLFTSGVVECSYMDPLARLFSSSGRLKLLRLFLFNDDTAFSVSDAANRTSISIDIARKEVRTLLMSGVIRKKSTKDGSLIGANRRFPYYVELQTFLRTTTSVNDADIVNSVKKAGTVRLIALSGLFTGTIETKADLLIVGDKLDDRQLEKSIHQLEAELGRELRFATFSTEDYKYRVGVYDRLLRDIFDYPHRTILDRINT
jgi:hypothetical protein